MPSDDTLPTAAYAREGSDTNNTRPLLHYRARDLIDAAMRQGKYMIDMDVSGVPPEVLKLFIADLKARDFIAISHDLIIAQMEESPGNDLGLVNPRVGQLRIKW